MLMASLGVFWGSFEGPLGDFLGSLDVLLAAVGCLGGPLGIPGVSWDLLGRLGCDFRDFPGNSGRPFGSILSSCFVFLSVFCWALFFDRFLKRFCIDFGTIFGAFLVSFFGTFQTPRKMLHTTKML
mgnify:CR=1 FL=1